jgi:eukaryotic-like serine/threonine-protein kinase
VSRPGRWYATIDAWRKGDGLARTPLRDDDPAQVGSYRLTARLGAGGMGVVYLATAANGSPVAVKVLRPELSGDVEFRTRFSREVAALTRVRGVCTVRVIEADTASVRPFLVTEYVEGPSLSEYIESRGPMDPRMLYGLATGLAEALTAIHAAGIVHRDLKPSNVLLTAGGPKVIDFGIAQVLDATAVTKAGFTVGSAGFMAPEQIMGRAGTAADIFSWAVTIAYAASGQSPFGTGTSDAIMYRILHDTPDIAAVPASLRPQVTAALGKEPQARPTAPELLSQLTRAAAQPAAAYDNPTQTILAQTWRPPTPPRPIPVVPPQVAATPPQVPAGPRQVSAVSPEVPTVRRSGARRPALFAIVLALAILVGAGGAALAFALVGKPATSSGTAPGGTGTHSQTAPATTPAVTSSSASASSPTYPSSSSPSQSASVSPSSSTALPVITVGSYSGIQPTEIAYSGDATNVVTAITWSSWTATGATGTGTSDIDNCVPSCAAASPNNVTATITLSDPVNGRFTQMTETRNGTTTSYTYPGTWAQSAS